MNKQIILKQAMADALCVGEYELADKFEEMLDAVDAERREVGEQQMQLLANAWCLVDDFIRDLRYILEAMNTMEIEGDIDGLMEFTKFGGPYTRNSLGGLLTEIEGMQTKISDKYGV